MIAVEDFLARLQKVKKQRGYWVACCPAHDDRDPSMSIRDYGADGIGVKCFSTEGSCTTTDIAHAAGIEPSDLLPDKDSKAKILDTYPYHGPDGELLYEVVRYVPKTFKQRRPKADGGWEWSLGDVQRVPYHLPELREGVDAGRWVFLVEGERDVHRLEDEGLVATTTPGGAANWSNDYAQWFTGGLVAIIPDNDPQGEEYAAKAAHAIGQVAKEVRVVKLDTKPKGDVSDWLYTHEVSELQELVRTTPPYSGGSPTPNIEAGDGAVTITWPGSAVQATLDRLRWSGGNVHGEVSVYWADQPLIEYQRVNTQSASARSQLVTELNRYDRDIEWHSILARLFGEAVRHQRTSDTFIDVRDQPAAEAPKFLVGDMWPDLTRFSILFGDGESAKSTLSLALLLSIASGQTLIAGAEPHRTGACAFIDYEDDLGLFNYRIQRLAKSYGIDLRDCYPILYQRAYDYLYEVSDSVRDQLDRNEVVAAVVDSRSGAQSGSLSSDDETRMLADSIMSLDVRAWLIDHIDKVSTKGREVPRHSFGSVFLRNRAVSSWYAKKVQRTKTEITVTLTDRKWNHGPERDARTLVFDWSRGIRIDRQEFVDHGPGGATKTKREMAVMHIWDHPNGLTSAAIAEEFGWESRTVAPILKGAIDADEIQRIGDRWFPVVDPY